MTLTISSLFFKRNPRPVEGGLPCPLSPGPGGRTRVRTWIFCLMPLQLSCTVPILLLPNHSSACSSDCKCENHMPHQMALAPHHGDPPQVKSRSSWNCILTDSLLHLSFKAPAALGSQGSPLVPPSPVLSFAFQLLLGSIWFYQLLLHLTKCIGFQEHLLFPHQLCSLDSLTTRFIGASLKDGSLGIEDQKKILVWKSLRGHGCFPTGCWEGLSWRIASPAGLHMKWIKRKCPLVIIVNFSSFHGLYPHSWSDSQIRSSDTVIFNFSPRDMGFGVMF